MELSEEVGEFKSEFAKKIAMEEKARNLNILRLQGQHSLKRGTSESVLGKCNKLVTNKSDLYNTKFHGSVGSLPSLVLGSDQLAVDSVEDENWVTSEHFKDILEQKEKEISEEGMKRLEEENAELRKRLEFADRRSSSVSLLGKSKFQELERDVTKLQAKICKMEQSSEDPNSTRRLVTFLETFKSQLPSINTSRDNHYDSGLDRTESYRPSIDSYRPSVQSYRPSIDSYDFGSRPSMGSYRAACREPLSGRADSCVAQFSRANAAALGFEVLADRTESVGSSDLDSEMRASRPVRSRVMMGAKTVQRARYLGSIRGRSGRAYSSSDLLGESRVREDEFLSSADEVYGERTPQKLNRSMQSRAKSYSNVLSYRDSAAEAASTSRDSGRGAGEADQVLLSSSRERKSDKCLVEATKTKGKDETKVQKFFKRIKKLVSKENKVKEEEESKGPSKMTRSLSHRIGKSKNPPKRLKSFHASSPRLRKDFNL